MDDHRNSILRWAEQGHLAAERVEEAMKASGALPDREDWRKFIDRLLLWSGAVLLATGVIFFFAYNWVELGNITKFGLVELLIVCAVGCCMWFGTESPAGKASLFVASILAGALLALFGQTYQTGADTFELFIAWAIIIIPWTVVCRLPALWILLITLVNLAVTLYFHAFQGLFGLLFGPKEQLWVLFIFNTAALALWEFFSRYAAWMNERWSARLISFASGGLVTSLAVMAIFDSRPGLDVAFAVYPVWLAACYGVYRYLMFDLFVLAGGVLSVIIVITSIMSRAMLHSNTGGAAFLLIGLIVIGLSAAGGFWLKNIAQEEKR